MLVWIVQFYVQPDRSTLAAYLPRWLADRHSITFIAVFVVLFTLKNLAAYFVSRSWYRFIGGIAIRLSRASLQKYQSSAFEEFVAVDSSVHIRRISFQPFEFCQYILAGIQQIITQVFLIGMAIVAIILFDARLFLLLLLILLPPVIGTFYFLKNRLNRAKLHLRSSNEQSFRHLLDALKG